MKNQPDGKRPVRLCLMSQLQDNGIIGLHFDFRMILNLPRLWQAGFRLPNGKSYRLRIYHTCYHKEKEQYAGMTYSGNQNACRGILRFFRLLAPCSLFYSLLGTYRYLCEWSLILNKLRDEVASNFREAFRMVPEREKPRGRPGEVTALLHVDTTELDAALTKAERLEQILRKISGGGTEWRTSRQ